MDFVAFDFETANSRADSACQLAAVRIRAGQIAAERSWLIRPPQNYFSRRNIAIHGIRPEHVADAGTMELVWPELLDFIDGEVLVAHNASFDIGVLVASLAAYDVACPHIEFSCTRAIARRTWPGRSGYGLKPLGTWLGVDFRHHDALEDSRCCARIALAAATAIEADSFPGLEKQLRLTRGRYSLGRVSGPRSIGGRSILPMATSAYTARAGDAAVANPRLRSATLASEHSNDSQRLSLSSCETRPQTDRRRVPSRGQIDMQAVIESAAGSLPLAHKQIVCLGTLRGLNIAETQQLIEALGGIWQPHIAVDTTYVVACGGTLLEDAHQVIARAVLAASTPGPPLDEPSMCSEAEMYTSRSTPIRLLSERQFLALLPGGKASIRW